MVSSTPALVELYNNQYFKTKLQQVKWVQVRAPNSYFTRALNAKQKVCYCPHKKERLGNNIVIVIIMSDLA